MIISASRRTDIPSFYSDWFIDRLKEGYALVPNPRNPSRISRVMMTPENTECIVFWSKNPQPIFNKLPIIDDMGYQYYFQITITAYDKNTEKNLPEKSLIIKNFQTFSNKLGANKVDWRYDPIFIREDTPICWHLSQFEILCKELYQYTTRCIISFLDAYTHINKFYDSVQKTEIHTLAKQMAQIAHFYGLPLFTCSESIDLSLYGIGHAACIDKNKIESIIGCPLNVKKDAGQRPACGCVERIEIGAYNTCMNGCAYCYANTSMKTVLRNFSTHKATAPMITGYPQGHEIITDRTKASHKASQITLFDDIQ